MSCEQDGPPEETQQPKPQVDVYAATRALERWLFGGQSLDSVRDGSASLRQLPSNWRDRAKLVGHIVSTPVLGEEGNVIDMKTSFEHVSEDNPQESSSI